jgi:hypothetical protein
MNTWIFDTALARLLSIDAVVLNRTANSQMVGYGCKCDASLLGLQSIRQATLSRNPQSDERQPHVARGYSLRETVVRAKLANWTEISDVALLKRCATARSGYVCCVSNCFGKTSHTGSKKVPVGRFGLWMARSSQRARQDGEPMEDSVQHQTAEFSV